MQIIFIPVADDFAIVLQRIGRKLASAPARLGDSNSDSLGSVLGGHGWHECDRPIE